MNRYQAHRPSDRHATARKAVWIGLCLVLVAMILIAWTAVPEPDLMACCK